MTEDGGCKASDESAAAAAAAASGGTKQRKKRKWDQPAEPLLSAGIPLNIGAIPGILLPGSAYPAVPLPNIVPTGYALPPQILPQSVSVPPNAAAVVQKLTQVKIQDELIAREIVINDAESSVRYKLTKRQTQEEIQKSTGAIVITRGKYRPPNGPLDGEKPLYLHISAGSHLKDTAERIKAVDHAALMVEEILKQGQNLQISSVPFSSTQNNGQVSHPFSTSIYLGFDADPSLNIAARIRGPNDQYINHIMNETGATVLLRGKGSGHLDILHAEASQQPLHLYLSSLYPQSLEAARVLAENLLDTIAMECGSTRVASSKLYGAVPPPQQLLAGVQSSATIPDGNSSSGASVPAICGSTTAPQLMAPTGAAVLISSGASYAGIPQNSISYTRPQNSISYTRPQGTFYSGYGDIYPQATPLQQVALALKQAPSSTSQSLTSLSNTTASSSPSMTPVTTSSSNAETDRRPPQKRKFQELPISKGLATKHQNSQQGSEFLKTGSEVSGSKGMPHPAPRNMSPPAEMPPPATRTMPPPAPYNMPPPTEMPESAKKAIPPPPPKFTSHETLSKIYSAIDSNCSVASERSSKINPVPTPKLQLPQLPPKKSMADKSVAAPVSDTLLKLMDYGEEDDDDENENDNTEGLVQRNPTQSSAEKPFWAV